MASVVLLHLAIASMLPRGRPAEALREELHDAASYLHGDEHLMALPEVEEENRRLRNDIEILQEIVKTLEGKAAQGPKAASGPEATWPLTFSMGLVVGSIAGFVVGALGVVHATKPRPRSRQHHAGPRGEQDPRTPARQPAHAGQSAYRSPRTHYRGE